MIKTSKPLCVAIMIFAALIPLHTVSLICAVACNARHWLILAVLQLIFLQSKKIQLIPHWYVFSLRFFPDILIDIQFCLTYTGTYSPVIQMEECDACPAGETCPHTAMNSTIPCPAGFYCPEGSYGDGTPCPSGKLLFFYPLFGDEKLSRTLTSYTYVF